MQKSGQGNYFCHGHHYGPKEPAVPLLVCRPLGAGCRCLCIDALPTTCAGSPAIVCRIAPSLRSRSRPQCCPPCRAGDSVRPPVPPAAFDCPCVTPSSRPPPSSSATTCCRCAARARPKSVATCQYCHPEESAAPQLVCYPRTLCCRRRHIRVIPETCATPPSSSVVVPCRCITSALVNEPAPSWCLCPPACCRLLNARRPRTLPGKRAHGGPVNSGTNAYIAYNFFRLIVFSLNMCSRALLGVVSKMPAA